MSGAFVPWPMPVAAGMLVGVAAASVAGPRVALVLGSLLLVGALAYQAVTRRPWPTTFEVSKPTLFLGFVVPLVLGAGAGLTRHAMFDLAPNPLEHWYEQEVTWRGHSDGSVLSAVSPVRARLALVAPSGGWTESVAPAGPLTVTGVAQPAPGKRNPGGFDMAAHLRRRGVAGQLFVTDYVEGPGLPVRQRLQRGVVAGLDPLGAGLMAAMTLGLRHDLGEVRDIFGPAGMAHLLALSGLHVGVLLLALERLLKPFRRWRTPLLMAATVSFVALVGASPSVIRAATMALAALASRAFGAGRVQPGTALALAALVGMLLAPQMLFDLSFQLSYLAVAGMLVLLPHWLPRLGVAGAPPAGSGAALAADPELAAMAGALLRRGRHAARSMFWTGLAVSTAAQLPSLSLVLHSFGVLPVLSPLVNVLAVPLAGLLVPLGFLAGILGLVAEPLARLVNLVTQPLVSALVGLARVGATLPLLSWGEISWLGHACWAVCLIAICAWARRPGRFKHTAVALVMAGGTTLAVPAPLTAPDVWFLDVGQGDAVLIRLGGGEGVLIDGGGTPFSDYDVGARVVLPALRALGVTRLSVVVATHPDTDHVEGLLPVLERLPVGLLVTGPPDPAAALDVQLRQLAARRGVGVHEARRGERLVLRKGAVTLDVLNPPATTSAPANERSVALVLRLGAAARALFLGDLGLPTEPELAVPPVDVLMVPHHGSRSSTGPGLLRAASPRFAVISVGRNNYGHPTPEVVERLQEHGAAVFVTQWHGAVRYDLARPQAAPSSMTAQPAW